MTLFDLGTVAEAEKPKKKRSQGGSRKKAAPVVHVEVP
jgi:hypothetical protein